MTTFDRFVAVDWSGAKGPGYAGIAVAECRPGCGAPRLVDPPGKRWRRTDFVEWLVSQVSMDETVLVGIDCAFALPMAAGERIMGPDYTAASLWARIEQVCGGHADYYGGWFAEQAAHAGMFWASGARPADFKEYRRATEFACRDAGLGAPESPLKLIGAKQVGKGGLAGMRTLAALCERLGENFGVWPFDWDENSRIVCVELYPRLFLRMAGHGNSKVRTWQDLNRCLGALGSMPMENTAPVSDHATDALVAAAGLRHIAGDPLVWSPPGLDALALRAEGWIFGVT